MRYFLMMCMALGLLTAGCSSEKQEAVAPMPTVEEQMDDEAVSKEITKVVEEVSQAADEAVNRVADGAKEVVDDMANSAVVEDMKTSVDQMAADNNAVVAKEAAAKEAEAKAKAEAQASIKEAIDAAELPDAAKEMLVKRFAEATTAEGIAEAIQAEVDYIAKLAESGKVRNLGMTLPSDEKSTKALREAVKTANPEWSDEMVETFVTRK